MQSHRRLLLVRLAANRKIFKKFVIKRFYGGLIVDGGDILQDFDSIYAEYFGEVYRYALSLCQNPSLAEEVTQETFFKALQKIDSFHGECRLGTWLCQIAKNTFFNDAKKRKRQAEYPSELISDENIEERFADQETSYAIHLALHSLKDPYKEVFWLRTFAEMQFAQIAALFGKTENWARVTYYRAKIMIREELT